MRQSFDGGQTEESGILKKLIAEKISPKKFGSLVSAGVDDRRGTHGCEEVDGLSSSSYNVILRGRIVYR